MPVEQQPPDVLAMIVADGVLRDVVTNKFFIQGTYNVIGGSSFPLTQPSIVVYAAVTEGYGDTEFKLVLVDANETREPIFEMGLKVAFPDPLLVVELVFAAPSVVFPEPGEYRLQLYGAGQPLRERRLQVIDTGQGQVE